MLDRIPDSAVKRVFVAQNPVDAQLVADELRAAGVHAVVKTDTVAAPSIPFPSVWVEDTDLQHAQDLLDDRAAPPEDDSNTITKGPVKGT